MEIKNQIQKMSNDIEGMLNDFEGGITEKEKTIVDILGYIVQRAEATVNNFKKELTESINGRIKFYKENSRPDNASTLEILLRDMQNDELLSFMKKDGFPVGAVVSDDMAETKQGFYVKAKIQSKVDLKCVFVTDHLVHLGDLPINQIEHAIYDEIAKRIKEREDDKYEILAIEKIILALDNPPEMT